MKWNNKGITLLALLITVIILLILSVITLSLNIGENGIIAKAKQAKENMLQAEKEEEEALNTLWAELENNGINIGDSVEVKEDESTKEYSNLKMGTITKSNTNVFEIPSNFDPDIIILYGNTTAKYQLSVIYKKHGFNIASWYITDGAYGAVSNMGYTDNTVCFNLSVYGTESSMYEGTFDYILIKNK